MINVICVYKSGGDYNARYVESLQYALQMYAPNHRFTCLTDVPHEVSCNTLPLTRNLNGWWSKIELFGIIGRGRFLYFDLDVIPLHNVDQLFEICEKARTPEFIALRSFDPVGRKNDWMSSSIMSWCAGHNDIYDEFFSQGIDEVLRIANTMPRRAGQRTDQGFIRTRVPDTKKFQDYLPDGFIVSKYEYLANESLMDNCHVLNWTGRPRLHKLSDDSMVGAIWKSRIF